MLNGDTLKNLGAMLLCAFMFWLIISVSMRAIDKMADRDCARGITTACAYVPAK